MALKSIVTAVIFIALLAWNGPSVADQYKADEFLSLDLSKAALSPKPLGPASKFEPVPVQAKSDRGSEQARARPEPKADPGIVARKVRVAHVHAKPHGAVHVKLARRHTNPLDAQAFDTRIQVWPCKSGGICDWKRQRN